MCEKADTHCSLLIKMVPGGRGVFMVRGAFDGAGVGVDTGWKRTADCTTDCNFVVVVSTAGTANHLGNCQVGFAGHKFVCDDKKR